MQVRAEDRRDGDSETTAATHMCLCVFCTIFTLTRMWEAGGKRLSRAAFRGK